MHRKCFNGKVYYWYGWCSEFIGASESRAQLLAKGDLVEIVKGIGLYHDDTTIGWNIWRRKA
jgi:hypothetical protein